MNLLNILTEQTEGVSEYGKTVLYVAALQLLMDRGLSYRPIVQKMMELETQYYNLQEDLEN